MQNVVGTCDFYHSSAPKNALFPQLGTALRLFGDLRLRPVRRARARSRRDCDRRRLCPDVRRECPQFGGVCVVTSQCGSRGRGRGRGGGRGESSSSEEEKEKQRCYCEVTVGC